MATGGDRVSFGVERMGGTLRSLQSATERLRRVFRLFYRHQMLSRVLSPAG